MFVLSTLQDTSAHSCAAKSKVSNRFCDGEAEQSEDEDVSSDESEGENENGQPTIEEVQDRSIYSCITPCCVAALRLVQ